MAYRHTFTDPINSSYVITLRFSTLVVIINAIFSDFNPACCISLIGVLSRGSADAVLVF